MRSDKAAGIDYNISDLLEIIENEFRLPEENQLLKDFIEQVNIKDYTLEVKGITFKVNQIEAITFNFKIQKKLNQMGYNSKKVVLKKKSYNS